MLSVSLSRSAVKKEQLPPYVVFIDTETAPEKEGSIKQKLVVGCYEVWSVTSAGVPKPGSTPVKGVFMDIDGFYFLIKNLPVVNHHDGPINARVVAHNWKFDASVLRFASKEMRKKHNFTFDMDRGIYPGPGAAGFTPFFMTLAWKDRPWGTTIICNTNFHKMSLAKLGESLRYPKLEMPPMKVNPTDDELLKIITYCTRDVEVLRRSWFSLFEFSKNVAGITPGLTAADMAKRMFLTKWFSPYEGRERVNVRGSLHNPYIAHAEEEAYHGGRTESFWNGPVPHNKTVRVYDVNSMYPSCMLGNVPIRALGSVDPSYCFDGKTHLALVKVRIPEYSEAGWLGWEGYMTKEAGLIFPRGEFECWAWQPMLDIARGMGWIVSIKSCIEYASRPLFKSYIEDVYRMRLEAKKRDELMESLLYKLLMNSLYGKLGQKDFGKWKLAEGVTAPDKDHDRWADYCKKDKDGRVMLDSAKEYWRVDEDRIYQYHESTGGMGRRSVCSIAGYITAKARAVMWRSLYGVHKSGATIYYCDTDSIHTDGVMPSHMVGDGLGQWALEKESPGKECEYNCPKDYVFANKATMKGIRNPVRGVSTYDQPQFPNFLTDLVTAMKSRGWRRESGAVIKNVTKTVTHINNKRVIKGVGPTEPLTLPLKENDE